MTLPSTATTRSLTVPGARLHYEIRSSGPLLLVIGSPMASADFAPLADALAGDRTVITYDPRGHANSTVDDPEEDSTPERRAEWVSYARHGGTWGFHVNEDSWGDVERALVAWLDSSGVGDRLVNAGRDHREAAERALLGALLAKYPDAVGGAA